MAEGRKTTIDKSKLSFSAMVPTAMVPTSMVPTAMVPTAIVPTAMVPTSMVPTAMVPIGRVDQEQRAANYWAGQRMNGKSSEARTPLIKNYWETNIQRDMASKERNSGRSRLFGFPRWRSNDALTASLVASKPNVAIPQDSKIPSHRQRLMQQTNSQAEHDKVLIQQSVEPKRNKKRELNKSNECLIEIDYQPWYNRDRIRDGVSKESIANLGVTRRRFEQFEKPEKPVESIRSNEQQLMMLFLLQHEEIVASLGIDLSDSLRNETIQLPWRIVELRPISDQHHQHQQEHYHHQHQQEQYQSPIPPPHRPPGRYQKNATVAVNQRFRRSFDVGQKNIPENRRSLMQEMDQRTGGAEMIAAEIRTVLEREAELRRSRSELGLPSLEEQIECWRMGKASRPVLRSAVSVDQLHQPMSTITKSGSIEHFHCCPDSKEDGQSEMNKREDNHQVEDGRSSRSAYKLQNSDDPDVMIYGPSSRRFDIYNNMRCE